MRLINCEEFIRLLNNEKAKHSSANYKQMRRGLCKAIRIAHEMDNEDAEPVRHGRWECCWSDPFCTECGQFAETVTNYRPNCGAKMRGENECSDG